MNAKIRTGTDCKNCAQPVTYDRTRSPGWQHAAQAATEAVPGGCTTAAPQQFCELCGKPVTFWQDAWADNSGCRPCGNYNRYSLGD
ncbi:hypothetical protein [Kitasatospora sp. NBC_01300]|uniref:hypothetical protein n=1 Tax=Kitasatospora sp. NBC_01300 TaxID=2903574 RepID=UPI002F9119A8|nr:hypothetical protein OG556_40990 [Kitasatospora sp. NBC_01300]